MGLSGPMTVPTRVAGMSGRIPLLCLLLAANLAGCTRAGEIGFRTGSPADDLPRWISPLLQSGLRPDWSATGSHLAYLDALVGNVYELELESGESRSLTAHFEHNGFTRARYLVSGDLLHTEVRLTELHDICVPSLLVADADNPAGERLPVHAPALRCRRQC